MYLRDIKKIKFGGISGKLVPYGFERTYDWVVESMNRRTPKYLELRCVDPTRHHSGKFNIKAEDDSGEKILNWIESNTKVVGKSMNELRDTSIDKFI